MRFHLAQTSRSAARLQGAAHALLHADPSKLEYNELNEQHAYAYYAAEGNNAQSDRNAIPDHGRNMESSHSTKCRACSEQDVGILYLQSRAHTQQPSGPVEPL